MESATVRQAPPLPVVVQAGLIFGLFLLAAIAWAFTGDRMAGMDAGPGTDPGTLGFWLISWVVMMAAMMFPSILPMVVMQARISEGKRRQGLPAEPGTTTLFVCGYLVTWAAAGLIGYAIIRLGQELSWDFLSWDNAGPYVAGGVIITAAAYELTPFKDVCLRKCRSPMAFLLTRWQPGRSGALKMGLEHGAWCVGCCWALMAALFAVGVMSIGWMVFIAALIAIEKLVPWRIAAVSGVAVLLLALGIAVAFAPERVPGLTLPDSAEAHSAMQSMGMDDGSMGDQGSGSMDQPSGGMNDAPAGMPGK
jgi:predicted metal-binding membrane protein